MPDPIFLLPRAPHPATGARQLDSRSLKPGQPDQPLVAPPQSQRHYQAAGGCCRGQRAPCRQNVGSSVPQALQRGELLLPVSLLPATIAAGGIWPPLRPPALPPAGALRLLPLTQPPSTSGLAATTQVIGSSRRRCGDLWDAQLQRAGRESMCCRCPLHLTATCRSLFSSCCLAHHPAAIVFIIPYLTILWKAEGMTGSQIGIMSAVRPFICSVSGALCWLPRATSVAGTGGAPFLPQPPWHALLPNC